MAYQVILEPGIGQFHEFESPRLHTRINLWGLLLGHKLACGKRESVSEIINSQHSMNIDVPWDCRTLRAVKNEGNKRGEEGTTPVTTACPEAERKMCAKKTKKYMVLIVYKQVLSILHIHQYISPYSL